MNDCGVNGEEHVDEQGQKWWMGTLVHPCPACGVAPTNVDDCGHFGDYNCPYFGIGKKVEHKVPCPDCGADDWYESDEDYGSLGDGGSYVKYKCRNCGHETGWQMLPD